jgi:DNA-binding transcriptional LysR family regulator
MELRHLRYFVAVAEELHFGRAAARLHLSQPPLSRQIRELEEELGVCLFERDRRRVALTSAGSAFLAEARDILSRSDRAGERVRRVSRGELGEIDVGFVTSATTEVFAAILRDFRRARPDVEVHLYDQMPQQQLDGLRAGRLDVGFLRPPIPDPLLRHECVWRDALALALPADHPLAKEERVRWTDITREPFVGVPWQQSPGFHSVFYEACRAAGFVPQIKQYANDLPTVIWLVSIGTGVAVVTAGLASLARPSVAFRPLEPSGPPVEMVVAWRRNETSPVVDAFLEVTRSTVGAAST